MTAHKNARSAELQTLQMDVAASRIIDLRDVQALSKIGIDLEDAIAPWQDVVARGGIPSSWLVRDRLIDVGANGIIDPSRTKPGLWHLVLFRWNEHDAPTVRLTHPE